MMREIKFRAWDEETEIMYYSDKCWEHAEATFVCESEGILKCYVPEIIEATRDEPEHRVGREIFPLMQFAGLKDKNGTNSYHKDIVRRNSDGPNYLVAWRDREAEFYLKCLDSKYPWQRMAFIEVCEIIGNAHENPELIENISNAEKK